MVPMVDTMMVPGFATSVIAVGPVLVGVVIALVAGIAWLARGTAEELRRQGAREWEARTLRVGPHVDRLAA